MFVENTVSETSESLNNSRLKKIFNEEGKFNPNIFPKFANMGKNFYSPDILSTKTIKSGEKFTGKEILAMAKETLKSCKKCLAVWDSFLTGPGKTFPSGKDHTDALKYVLLHDSLDDQLGLFIYLFIYLLNYLYIIF